MAGPVPDGVTLTVTYAGPMVPDGNPDPVTFTVVTPTSAELGTVYGESFTEPVVLACKTIGAKSAA